MRDGENDNFVFPHQVDNREGKLLGKHALSLRKASSFSKYIGCGRKRCLAALVLTDSLKNLGVPSGLDFWRGPFLQRLKESLRKRRPLFRREVARTRRQLSKQTGHKHSPLDN